MEAISFFAIIGTLAMGVISPGPSFVVVARLSVSASRRDGLAAAVGMGIGGVVFGALALFGLQTILAHVSWLYDGLRLLGGAYLVYLAIMIWRGAADPIPVSSPDGMLSGNTIRSLALGLATQLSNPKTAVVYASIFAAFLPKTTSGWAVAALLPLIFAIEASWYGVVALVLSAGRPRSIYLKAKRWIDRGVAAVIGGLGVRLMAEVARPR